MSGPENIRGFDYQISYSLLKTLEHIQSGTAISAIQFESIDENEEDFNIIKEGGNEYHQIKKRIEGNHWTPSDLKKILDKFISKDDGITTFYFVTDGTANPEVKKLKNKLDAKEEIEKLFLEQFLEEGRSIDELKKILKRTFIQTRYFSSDDDTNPAKNLKSEILRLLIQPPFNSKNIVESCYSSLWKLLFDFSRDAEPIYLKEIIEEFEKIGLYIEQRSWFDTPDISDFLGRENEIGIIKNELNKTHKLIIYGINGIGKTWISLKTVLELFPKNTCWIKVNFWTSIEYINFNVVAILYSKGFNFEAQELQNADIAERIPILLKILEKIEITLVIDSVNSGNNDLKKFIEQLVENSVSKKLIGNLIITSTHKINGYTNINIEKGDFSVYNLFGFSLEDTRSILRNILAKDFPITELDQIHDTLGGHPMSIFFLKQLLENNIIESTNFTSLEFKTIEATRDWILEKSIMSLSDSDRENLLKLSLFEGDIDEDEIAFILEVTLKPRYILKSLLDNHLISYSEENIIIHDSIKEIARNILDARFSLNIYKKLTDFYFSKMELEKATDDLVLYDVILKWGYNLEQLKSSEFLENKYKILLTLDSDCKYPKKSHSLKLDINV
ncbi:dsDNA nuclease domain-containing protein [Sphingobacterium spiritivorum]|uniref:dsDNA nuclease domain-containing protein n=1 Tax=Sphingobacterium spiritivorum TaxID=258 RepID=UPI003DA671CA